MSVHFAPLGKFVSSMLFAFLLVIVVMPGSLALAQSWNTLHVKAPDTCKLAVPDYTFDVTAGYTPGNAFLALLAATIAESWSDTDIRNELSSFGFTDTHLIGKYMPGSYGYITEAKDVRILAFRGTHSVHEGLIDLSADTLPYEDVGIAGKGHAGMKLSFKILWELTKNELASRQRENPKPLLIVGHSLGGSLAMLHAMKLKKLGYPIFGVYTAAQPRIGDETFMAEAEALIGDRLYRMENTLDPIPRLPPTAANAKAFADVFAQPESTQNIVLQNIVENLNYAPLPGWTLELTDHGFFPKQGAPAEFESEMSYLKAYQATLDKAREDNDVAIQIGKIILAHIGDSYVCNFLELVSKGYQPISP